MGAGYDVDPSCGYAYTANNGDAAFIAADIRNIAYEDLRPHFADADVTALVGCGALPALLGTHPQDQKYRHGLLLALGVRTS